MVQDRLLPTYGLQTLPPPMLRRNAPAIIWLPPDDLWLLGILSSFQSQFEKKPPIQADSMRFSDNGSVMASYAADDLNVLQAAYDKAIATLSGSGPIDEDIRDTVAVAAIASMAKAGQIDVYRLQLFAILKGRSSQRPHHGFGDRAEHETRHPI